MDQLRNILEYDDFCWKPPVNRIYHCGSFFISRWLLHGKPVVATTSSKIIETFLADVEPHRKQYRLSQETLSVMFAAVIAFYKYVINEEICYGNPPQVAKSDCRYFINDVQVTEVR
jgi:hypothetical protein